MPMKIADRTIVSNNLMFVRFNSGGEYETHGELRSVVFWMFGLGFIVHWRLGDLLIHHPCGVMVTYGRRGISTLYRRVR